MHTLEVVELEWDERKAAANLLKHGVDFADAAVVLEDDLALTLRDPDARGEQLISARKATAAERRRYETGL